MLNIKSILEKMGQGSAKYRALSMQISDHLLNQQIMVQRIEGMHEINLGFSAEAICLSTNPFINLKDFVGCLVAIDQTTDIGSYNRSSGIVVGASAGQSDGGLTCYKLEIADATHLWKHRINSRVFMNKSVLDIVEILFKEWQKKSPLFAQSLKLDMSGVQISNYDIRPFIMQFCESDFNFITRLLREEGINFLIDEANHTVSSLSESLQAQKFRLIDDNKHFTMLKRQSIRYHRSDATERSDTLTSLIAHRNLNSTAIHLQRWQSDLFSQQDACGSVLSNHKHSSQISNQNLNLESSYCISPAWISDLKSEDGATKSSNEQVERLNKHLNSYQELKSKCFIARGSVRDVQVGYYFSLNEHPEIDRQHLDNNEFLILKKCFYNQNNLPKDIADQIEFLLDLNHWDKRQGNEQERQGCELLLVRKNVKVVPEYHPLDDKPVARVMRAKVVGADGEAIHTDEWGRVKVQFLFSREDNNTHDGGAGSNNSDTDSAWLDSLTPWAYNDGGGARFLPRVGEIVVVDFFNGDIDRPFIMGRLHESDHKPVKFDQKGTLPETRRLSGIRSQEISGKGFGQLRFDDTPSQISTQLQSSHGASQLNLGHLSYPKESDQSDDRG